MAPEIPSATYSFGATVWPELPIWRSIGSQPASQIGREAPSSAPIASASWRASAIFSSSLIPRPTATMRSACERSTACFASRNGGSGFWRIAAASMRGSIVCTSAGVAPRTAASARNAPIWKVASVGVVPRVATSASSRPWKTGRTNNRRPSCVLVATQSVTSARSKPRRERRREVARLIGVRQEDERRPGLSDELRERGHVRVARVGGQRRRGDRQDLLDARGGELGGERRVVGPEKCDVDRRATRLLRRGNDFPGRPVEHAALLFRDDENHDSTLASSRRRRTSSLAASAGDPAIIWVCFVFSGT